MFKLLNKKKNNKGFTLVELVIVIAILAILVGLLAPQYTKYVEKSRKTADANNMDEIVKVIKGYAADPASELEKGDYKITIGDGKTTTGTKVEHGDKTYTLTEADGLGKELADSIPNYTATETKSKKWGASGATSDITATVKVNEDGGTSVTYTPTAFENYMKKGTEK